MKKEKRTNLYKCSVCEAIIDLFRDEYDEGIAKEKQLGGQEEIISLFRKSLLSMGDAPGELNVGIEVFKQMLNKEETFDNDTKSAGLTGTLYDDHSYYDIRRLKISLYNPHLATD